ncbi:hypothetical protein [Chloroherpeton thalassium]|nr:hypothetical protein [Chloroherpeton thalassium]
MKKSNLFFNGFFSIWFLCVWLLPFGNACYAGQMRLQEASANSVRYSNSDSSSKQLGFRPQKSLDDTAKVLYKFLEEPPQIFSPHETISRKNRDFLFHSNIGDYFSEHANIFLRDKVEFGQLNELLIGGLGTRYQHIFLDDVLLNDPITMSPIYQYLSTESFSSLRLQTGYMAGGYSWSPIVLESTTQRMVVANGFTRIHYYQFLEGTLKTDVTFSVNFSERLNFYCDYARESTDGRFTNIGGSGTSRYGSSYEGNKFNVQFRYQLGKQSYLTLADYFNSLLQKPYGGVDYATSVANDLDPLDPLSAVIKNQYTERALKMNALRVELQTRLPFFSDSSNVFKAWIHQSIFSYNYEKTEESLQDSSTFHDKTNSSRWTLGASQLINLPFLILKLRGNYLHDKISEQNILENESGEEILPISQTLALQGAGRMRFDHLIFGQTFEAGGSLALVNQNVSETGGEDHSGVLFNVGAGGKVVFPIPLSEESKVEAFLNLSRTERLPSLLEVFSSDSSLSGSHSWQKEKIRHLEFGAAFFAGKNFQLRASFINNNVASPLVVVQQADGDSLVSASYRSLDGENLNYTGIGLSAKFNFGRFETTLDATTILDYSLLSNPDNDYADSLSAYGYDESGLSSNQVFYLPKFYLSYQIYYNANLFDDALKLKFGLAGFFMTDMSSSLQSSERQNTIYFNLVEQNGTLSDNNLQFGVQGLKSRVDFRLWAEFGSAVITLSFENLLDEVLYKTPIYQMNERALRFGFNWILLD